MSEETSRWLTKEEQKLFIKNAKDLYEKFIKRENKKIMVGENHVFDLTIAINYFVLPKNGINKKIIYLEKEGVYCVDIASVQYNDKEVQFRICGTPSSCKLQIDDGNTVMEYS